MSDGNESFSKRGAAFLSAGLTAIACAFLMFGIAYFANVIG